MPSVIIFKQIIHVLFKLVQALEKDEKLFSLLYDFCIALNIPNFINSTKEVYGGLQAF